MKRIFEIVVTNIEMTPASDLRPPLAAHTDIQQIINGDIYLYASTNREWLSAVEAKKIGVKMHKPGRRPPVGLNPRSIGGLAKMILLVLLLSPLIYFLFKFGRSRNKNSKQ